MKSSPLITYIENIKPHRDLLESYEIVRKWLQESGMTSKEIENVTGAPPHIWKEYENIKQEMGKVKLELSRYGMLDSSNEDIFNNFMLSELNKISVKYPLRDEPIT